MGWTDTTGRITPEVIAPHRIVRIYSAMQSTRTCACPSNGIIQMRGLALWYTLPAREVSFSISLPGVTHVDYLLHELAYFDVYFGINRWRRLQGRSKVAIGNCAWYCAIRFASRLCGDRRQIPCQRHSLNH